MPYIHNFKEQTHLTANCFNKINFQTISSITIDFYIVSFLYLIEGGARSLAKYPSYIWTNTSKMHTLFSDFRNFL